MPSRPAPTLTWLHADAPLPPADTALINPPGLVAAGGDLSLPRLRDAYRRGIFPWYEEGDPILWWSPDPRMVLACDAFAPSHSLRKRLRAIARAEADAQYATKASVQIRVDTAFEHVIAACARPRHGMPDTTAGIWITPAMQQAYQDWHHAGEAHSIETWIDGKLAGGLYGVSIGAMFYGESMFTRVTDAAKIALAYLVRFLARAGSTHIDCQQVTSHLARLGAVPEPRSEFLARLRILTTLPGPRWQRGWLDSAGRLRPL